MDEQACVNTLSEASARLLVGCRVRADDGTVLYTPDGEGNYPALWTRDFAYMVEYAGDLIPAEHVEACLRYLIRGLRSDGAAPDRVRPDGVPVYSAGGEEHPLGLPNLDNPQFLVVAADEHLRRLPAGRATALFREWAPALDRGMDYIPRSPRGLVYNDPQNPHSPYGFTDTVGKTGELLMESLLYWAAAQRLAALHVRAGNSAKAADYQDRAAAIETGIGALWDDAAGAFLAATEDCRQLDIWGNAYALYIGFPLAERGRVAHFLVENYERCVWRGQVRHLLEGEHWQRLLAPVAPDRYQNGAYWATASGWVIWAIAQEQRDLAQRMLSDLVADFQEGGVCECINEGYRKLQNYVVSATNPLAGARRLAVVGRA